MLDKCAFKSISIHVLPTKDNLQEISTFYNHFYNLIFIVYLKLEFKYARKTNCINSIFLVYLKLEFKYTKI